MTRNVSRAVIFWKYIKTLCHPSTRLLKVFVKVVFAFGIIKFCYYEILNSQQDVILYYSYFLLLKHHSMASLQVEWWECSGESFRTINVPTSMDFLKSLLPMPSLKVSSPLLSPTFWSCAEVMSESEQTFWSGVVWLLSDFCWFLYLFVGKQNFGTEKSERTRFFANIYYMFSLLPWYL